MSRKARTLPLKLQDLKKFPRETCGRGQPRSQLIRVLNERSVNDGGDQFDIVSETHFTCDTVGRELWLAMLNSLQCPETDRNIRIGKQGYVFILPIFLTSVGVSTVVLTLGKVEFLK